MKGASFAFELGQPVQIEVSGERGRVIGRVEYSNTVPMYQVEYKAADGRSAEAWFYAQQLGAVT